MATIRSIKRDRYYRVVDKLSKESHLVKATSKPKAREFIANLKDQYEVTLPSQDELINMLTVQNIKPLDATAAPADAPKDDDA